MTPQTMVAFELVEDHDGTFIAQAVVEKTGEVLISDGPFADRGEALARLDAMVRTTDALACAFYTSERFA